MVIAKIKRVKKGQTNKDKIKKSNKKTIKNKKDGQTKKDKPDVNKEYGQTKKGHKRKKENKYLLFDFDVKTIAFKKENTNKKKDAPPHPLFNGISRS